MTDHLRRSSILLAILAVLAGGCSGNDDAAAPADSSSSSVITGDGPDSNTTASNGGSSTSADGASSSTSGDTSSTTSGVDDTTLPGDDIELFAREGDVLAVMGVAHDDALNVRAAPGTDQAVVFEAAPTADDLVATGRARQLSQSLWYEVTVGGTTGWVGVPFVGYLGVTDDFTAEFLDGGDAPAAETMVDLGEIVAAEVATDEPPSRVVQSVAPSGGDVAEVTYDVIQIGDDAVAGYRLHIFATEDDNGETLSLRTIERTTFCSRGLTGELCS